MTWKRPTTIISLRWRCPESSKIKSRSRRSTTRFTSPASAASEKKTNAEGGYYSERRFGKFHRTFKLPSGVSSDKVEAHYQDGMLRVYVPKAETAKPRQIKISNGSGTGLFGKLLGASATKDKEDRPDRVA